MPDAAECRLLMTLSENHRLTKTFVILNFIKFVNYGEVLPNYSSLQNNSVPFSHYFTRVVFGEVPSSVCASECIRHDIVRSKLIE